jgi:hypothetical protein
VKGTFGSHQVCPKVRKILAEPPVQDNEMGGFHYMGGLEGPPQALIARRRPGFAGALLGKARSSFVTT